MSESQRRAALVTPFFVDRDAVCNDVYHGAEALRRRGWDARIFAVGSESARERALPLEELGAFIRSPQDLAYMHFSTGRRELAQAIRSLRCRKVLKYHNITPPEMFSMWSDELAEASRLGRAELPRVAALGWEQVWADSSFNLREIEPLLPAGTSAGVLPPFHEIESLVARRPSARKPARTPRLLTVGRLVQSKGHPFLLRVMRYLVHELGVDATLDIVGKPDHRLLAYMHLLQIMVGEFRIEANVRFAGEVSEDELARHYAEADVFVMTSEHEGFCVPIAEAMAFGVPVVALGLAAVPETVGDAGIVWEERDPRRFALSIRRLVESRADREWLGEQGRRRFEASFANRLTEQRMAAALRIDEAVAARAS